MHCYSLKNIKKKCTYFITRNCVSLCFQQINAEQIFLKYQLEEVFACLEASRSPRGPGARPVSFPDNPRTLALDSPWS